MWNPMNGIQISGSKIWNLVNGIWYPVNEIWIPGSRIWIPGEAGIQRISEFWQSIPEPKKRNPEYIETDLEFSKWNPVSSKWNLKYRSMEWNPESKDLIATWHGARTVTFLMVNRPVVYWAWVHELLKSKNSGCLLLSMLRDKSF